MNKTSIVIATALISCGLSAAALADPRTVNDGVYTEAQADAGEALYKDHCLICHDKKYFRPVLKRWDGQQLSTFFTIMSASMPESNPGSLPDDQYLDILAYILSLSRYPDGDAPLHNDDGALADITIANRK